MNHSPAANGHRSDTREKGTAGPAPPVMLALSTFRKSDKAIELALQRAAEHGTLMVVFVVDVNLARYLVGSDIGMFPDLREKCEAEVLKQHRQQAEQQAKSIAEMSATRGITAKTRVSVGRFGIECMKVISQEQPELVVTTRSNRPAWVRRLFGSPVDYLIENADCPVIEA